MSQPANEPREHNLPPATERAEYLVDQIGMRLGRWTNNFGHEFQRFWARSREEGEDILAEANDVRHRNQVGSQPVAEPDSDEAAHSTTSRDEANTRHAARASQKTRSVR